MKREVAAPATEAHPMDELLRMDRIPHIWCPTCGLGTVVTAFASAVDKLEIPLDDLAVVSGIGCTGRVAGYIKVDSFHTTHGRAIPFATGLHLTNPKLKVVVISGDGDLISIGGNHFIHAARRNVDITVICVNNFIYAMTGGQVAPTTPLRANASTMPYGNFERPFNIPYLAESSGAVYVARWTALHVRRLTKAIAEALQKPGFSVVEVISPCSTLYSRRNRIGTGLDLMKFYHDNCEIKHGADTRELDIGFQEEITVGKFIDTERPTYVESMNTWYAEVFGDQYEPYEGSAK
ncbi:MAG: 2-oxoacid:ferredoxin oxidoreductase subunit beta [Candidatus Eisenbacteria bacterium]|nr:2-oxoacid:ferredoxin oxidoreductase subunit beta [Candidatus Eisenbacteria bacterium]